MGITAAVLFLLFAISKPTLTAPVDCQPIKIIANENFNSNLDEVEQQLPSLAPNYVHQGANFFINPEVRLLSGLIPAHIEALRASLLQKDVSIELESKPETVLEGKEKIITAELKPMEPVPEVVIKDDVDVVEAIKITEKPILEPIEVLPELPIPELIEVPVEISVSKPVEIIEEDVHIPPVSINDEQEVIIQELKPMPEAPVLPPSSLDFMHPVIIEEEKIREPVGVVLPYSRKVNERPIFLEESVEVLPSMQNLLVAPIPQPIAVPKLQESLTFDRVMMEEEISPITILKPIETFESSIVEKDLKSEIVQNPTVLLHNNIPKSTHLYYLNL